MATSAITQFTAMGIAGINLGMYLYNVLRGLKPPEPVEMPSPPQPPIQYPSIITMM